MAKTKYIQSRPGAIVNGCAFGQTLELEDNKGAEDLHPAFVKLSEFEKEQARLEKHRARKGKAKA